MLFVSCGLCLVAHVLSKSQSRVGLSGAKSTVKVIVLRTPSDQIAFGVGGEKWRLAEPVVGILAALSWVFVQPKLI